MSKQLRIAMVVQRYGEQINGGAEQHARLMANRLASYADVHVLTTCAHNEDWQDVFEPGSAREANVMVHRFAVDHPRDYQTLERLGRIFLIEHTIADEMTWLQAQGPMSSTLIRHIEANEHDYDVFIFFTFEYATTYFGMPRVAAKSILLPLAHDHPFTRSGLFRHLFHLPAGIGYNTFESRRLVQSITSNQHVPNEILGIGLDRVESFDVAGFRERFDLAGDFLLFIGRIDTNKNIPELLDFHLRYCDEHPDAPPLALIGRINNITLPDHPKVRHLGFVSDEDIFNALKAASVFIIPSLYESMSMVLLEAWSVGTVTMAHANCSVTREQTRRSNGGLFYGSYDEYKAALTLLINSPALRKKLGD
ncbi:MAG: glycosyltransferase family 4 protein, partial [Candidatus Promineifilaceae bacterium]